MTSSEEAICHVVDNLITHSTIKYINDGKEKHQSHEASIEGDMLESMHNGTFDTTGYGASKEEALANLRKGLCELFTAG